MLIERIFEFYLRGLGPQDVGLHGLLQLVNFMTKQKSQENLWVDY